MQRFGQKLRTLRRRHHMTIKQLARALGQATHSYISEIETGKKPPTLEIVIGVARLFDVTTDQLLKDEFDLDPDMTEDKEHENDDRLSR